MNLKTNSWLSRLLFFQLHISGQDHLVHGFKYEDRHADLCYIMRHVFLYLPLQLAVIGVAVGIILFGIGLWLYNLWIDSHTRWITLIFIVIFSAIIGIVALIKWREHRKYERELHPSKFKPKEPTVLYQYYKAIKGRYCPK